MPLNDNISVEYAFTITLRPKMFIHEPEKQYDETYTRIEHLLRSLCICFTLVAEMTKSYNIHYHGICNFLLTYKKDCMKEFHKCFRNDMQVGFVNIRQITNMSNWTEYLMKDLAKTTNSLNRRPIIKDDFNVFSTDDYANFGLEW